jgi:hypothetical protein
MVIHSFIIAFLLCALTTNVFSRLLTVNTLLTGTDISKPYNNMEFVPSSFGNCDFTKDTRSCWDSIPEPRVNLNGVLTITGFANTSRHFFNLIWVDSRNATAYPQPFDIPVREYLPPFSYQYYAYGNNLLPKVRGYQSNSHPYWEYILSPSKCWTELGDGGDYDRCVLLFTVTEYGQNCLYNGMATFVVNHITNKLSQVWYQVTNSYCGYYQWDNWGFADVSFTPNMLSQWSRLATIDQFNSEQETWLPIKSISQLTGDVATITGQVAQNPFDINNNVFNFYDDHVDCSNPVYYGHTLGIYGVIYNNTIYQGISSTRTGIHPYPQYVIYPQYSHSQSNIIGLTVGSLIQKYGCTFPINFSSSTSKGNACLLDLKVSDWISEEREQQGPNTGWNKVSLQNLIDMSTSHYNSLVYGVDEANLSQNVNFFYSYGYNGKISFSLNGLTDQTAINAPGTVWSYNSVNFFLAARLLNQVILKKTSYTSVLDYYQNVLCTSLELSSTFCKMRVTNDTNQIFGGYGVYAYMNDIGRLGRFWAFSDNGKIDGIQIIDPLYYKNSMQLNSNSSGLSTLKSADPGSTCYPNLNINILIPGQRYHNGFWSDLTSNSSVWTPITDNCQVSHRHVFESGYGGLRYTFSNQKWAYFQGTDNYDYKCLRAIATLDNLIGCPQGVVD